MNKTQECSESDPSTETNFTRYVEIHNIFFLETSKH